MIIYLSKNNGSVFASPNLKETLIGLKDGFYELDISKEKKVRSMEQNRYYHGVVIPLISQSTGYTNEEVHELMKKQFLSKRKKVMGKFINKYKSTTKLSTEEFNEYIEKIRAFALKHGIYIPLPNEVPLSLYD